MRSLWPVIETFRARGRTLEPLLEPFGLRESDTVDPDRRIPQDVVADVWDHAAHLAGDPSLGISALATLSSQRRTLVEYVLLNSPTLGSMIERGLRYERLWQEGREASLEIRGDRAELAWTTRPGLRFSPPLSEFAIGMVVLLARAATGQRLEGEVCFPHAAPADLAPYEAVFGSEVCWSAGEMSVSFSAELLALPLPNADASLLTILESQAAEVLRRLPKARSTAESVRGVVIEALHDGRPTLSVVADRLKMSERTLRRRLESEGASYRQIVEELRRELALEYLRHEQMSVTEAAFLLGFSDVATFSKAFRRWTGSSPSAMRMAASDKRSGHG